MSDSDLRSQLEAAAVASGMLPGDESAADVDPSAEASPEADASPALDPQDAETLAADDEADDDEEAVEPEPSTEAELRAEVQRLRESEATRLQEQQQREAEQRRLDVESSKREWAQAEQRLEGWLWQSMDVVERNHARDEILIANSDDQQVMRNILEGAKAREKEWVRQQYRSQKGIYDQNRVGVYEQALYNAHVEGFARQWAENYRLPEKEVKRVMFWDDGSPVDPNAYPARAAEIADQRRNERSLKRQTTQAEKSANAATLRRGPSIGTGGGNAISGGDEMPWRDQLAASLAAQGLMP